MPKMFLYLLVLGLWPFLAREARAQTAINQLPAVDAQEARLLTGEYMIDSTDRLTIQHVAHRPLRWQPMAEPTLVLGFTTHPVWCRLTLQQPISAPRSYALELTNFYVDSVTIYQPDSLKSWQPQFAGDLIPYARRSPKTRYPTLYITLAGTAPQTLYARIASTQHHNYAWRAWGQATFITQRLPDSNRYVMFTLATILALFELMLLLLMHQYVVLRSYAISSLAVCLSVLFGAGFPSIYFPNSSYWANTSHYIAVGLLMPAVAHYILVAFRLAQNRPPLVWLYRGFGLIGLLYAGLSLVVRHPYITWVFIAVLAIMYGFTLLLLGFLFFRKQQPVLWNIPAMLITLPVYTYFYGRNAGFFPGSVSEEAINQIMFFSFASEPLFVALILWHTTREGIRTAASLSAEQAQREAIQALDALKTTFFTNVSHELRTPLTLLLGPLQTLSRSFPDNELYGLMHRNANRLQTLINQLLDLAKLDARQMQHLPAPGDLANNLSIWVALFDSLAKSRSVVITLRQNETYWPALYDADKIEKILTNLLSNALKYTPAGGTVEVDVWYTPAKVSIEVRDTGTGIAADELPHLFDRFYQGKAPNRQEMGTGVGLALTHELIQLLGGTITVRSQPGEETAFRVELPIQRSASPPSPAPNGHPISPRVIPAQPLEEGRLDEVNRLSAPERLYPAGLPAQTEKPLLLLVEDNADLRTYIRLILAPHYTLLEAVDGQQGREMAFEALPELIVTDLMMPRLDGLDLCRALRADFRTDHIPLVMLTAKATVSDRLVGLETGADDYLTKPFLPNELLLRLQNLHRRQAAVRAYWQRTLTSQTSEETLPLAQLSEQTPLELPPFLKQLYAIVDQHLDQPDFDVEQLADALAVSPRTLTRKLKGLLDLTAREVIRAYRLQRGKEMLEQDVQPTQVAYAVGFGSASSFGRAYKEQYGHAPSSWKANPDS